MFFSYLSFEHRVSLCSPGYPWTCHPLPSASQVLCRQVCTSCIGLDIQPIRMQMEWATWVSLLGPQIKMFLPELVFCPFLLFMSCMPFIPMHVSLVNKCFYIRKCCISCRADFQFYTYCMVFICIIFITYLSILWGWFQFSAHDKQCCMEYSYPSPCVSVL